MIIRKVKSSIDLNSSARILNIPVPVNSDDLATKDYVDDLADTVVITYEFKYLNSSEGLEYYNLLNSDLGYLIECDTTYNNVDIRLPTSFAVGWWCTIIKESSNNLITFSSDLPIRAKGVALTTDKTPAHLTYTDQGYWRIIGELVNI